ncbi:ABC transporter permease [Flavitalea flava]
MIRNYFKIAWRNLVNNKAYSILNISGLAIGMAVVFLIGLWIVDNVNYNKNFLNYDRIVHVMINSTHGNDIRTLQTVPIPLAGALRTQYAGDFKKVSLASWNFSHVVSVEDKLLSTHGIFAQPGLVDMLTLRMIRGTSASFDDPSSLLISHSLASSLFGDRDPINKLVKIDNKKELKVTGIYEDFPYNSSFNEVNLFVPWAFYSAEQPWVKSSENQWNSNSFQIYIQLQESADLNKVNAKIKSALTGHNRNDKPEVLLHPMSKWRLYDEFKNGKNTGGAITFVWMFGTIGLFVLLLACINFMNLSTARSEKRAKEVGIRKAVGSLRRQLIFQFLGESLLIAFLAFGLSLLLVRLALPFFNQLADKQLSIPWTNPLFCSGAIGFTLFAGLVSGSYPAFYLSSFNSVKVLKGTFKAGRLASLPRKILIVLQFTVSISLIIGTIVVFQQIVFVRNRPVGYTRDGLLTVDINTDDLTKHYEAIRTDLIRSGAALNVAVSSSPTTSVYSNQSGFSWTGKDPNVVPSFGVIRVDHDFGKTIGFQFADGRDFSRDFASDSAGMILNESAARYMGFKNAVGSTVEYLYSDRKDKNYRVIGVVKDLIMENPFAPVKPTIFMIDQNNENANVITVKANPALAMSQALPKIESIFKKYNPGSPFDYTFNDEDYARKFQFEERIGRLAGFFTVFAIFISCLGLFGMASFMAEQRVKEIGVRKVLGASVLHLWGLLSKDFLLLVLLSFFLAVPVSYYVMHNWLQHYDYRTSISLWVFVVTIVGALLITLATVSFQSIKAALANPVKSLRSE